jgi:hypothetical protein
MSVGEFINDNPRLSEYPYYLLYAIICELIDIGVIDNVG